MTVVATARDLMRQLEADLAHDATYQRATLHHDELVTLTEAARRLHRPYGTVARWLSEHRFQPIGRVGKTIYVHWGDVAEAEYRIRTRRNTPKDPAPAN